MLSVDLKGGLKALPQRGELYKEDECDPTHLNWPEKSVEIRNEKSIQKNKFQADLDAQCDIHDMDRNNYDLDNDVEVWSDYLYARYHHRTLNIINQYEHKNHEVSFDVYPLGRSLWYTEQFQEDFSDKIRQYIEECDSFQVSGHFYLPC